MKKASLISVIVATYNQEATIARTLDSILCQKCHLPIEIVIGEDCSTDHTRIICEEYARQYPTQIRLLGNDHNKGIVDNYFDCILACKGDFIADCAGDDFWVDEYKLEKESQLLEAAPDITLVHTAWRSYNAHTHVAKDSPPQPFPSPVTDGKDMLEAIITQTYMPVIHLCTSLYRADVILREYHAHTSLFRNKDWPCEDLQIAFFMALSGKIAYLPDVTLHYTQGEDTISSPREILKQFDFFKRATDLSHKLAEEYDIRTKATRHYFSQRTFTMYMHAFRAHDKNLRQQALKCQQSWNTTNNFSIWIIKRLTANEPLWSSTLKLRKLFVMLKKVFR